MIIIVILSLILMGLLWLIFATCVGGAPEDVEWMEEDDE